MQRYINQVLADLEVATSNAPEVSSFRYVPRFMDEDDEEEKNFVNTKNILLYELFGIGVDIFPPVERLTRSQVVAFLTAFEKLWKAWNITWQCPPQLTARKIYTIMASKMSTFKVDYSQEEGGVVDFCEGRTSKTCMFGDINDCQCLLIEKIKNEDESLFITGNENEKTSVHTDWFKGEADMMVEIEKSAEGILALHRWFFGEEDGIFNPWEEDEAEEKWHEFVDTDEESVSWLYFFQKEDDYEDEFDINPEDFEDFEWNSDPYDGDYDLPF
jgi:hypothetical protein